MSLSALYKKAARAGSLARGRSIKLGGREYRIKGLLPNPLALSDERWEAEPWLNRVIRSVLQCGTGAFLDAGANLGQTMFKVLALDPSRRYIGFEPQLACCLMTQRFLDENGIKTFTILPVGLFNASRVLRIHGGRNDYDSTASVVEGFRPNSFYSSDHYVCVVKGDDALTELGVGAVSAIKVDVEGAELEVFEGLVNTIEASNPFLIFEVLNHYLAITGSKLDDQTIQFRQSRIKRLERLLRPRGYEIFNIRPGNQLVRVEQINPLVSADLSMTNYVAAHQSRENAFLKAYVALGGSAQPLLTGAA